MNRSLLVGVLYICSSISPGQSISPPFAQISIGVDGLIHLVTSTGHDNPIKKMEGQVGVSSPRLSADKQFAGWTIEQANCCTSYPIPTSLAIYSGKKLLYLHDKKMVVGWCFVPGKPQVVLATETVHGWTAAPDLYLYSARSGGLLNKWSGEADAPLPAWAKCLKA